jgi:hypothetical protein
MNMLSLSMLLGTEAAAREARSALPGAPVVPDQPSRRHHTTRQPVTARPRSAVASGLERLAALIAPHPARGSHPLPH